MFRFIEKARELVTPNVFQVSGLLFFIIAGFLLSAWVGFAVAGVCACFVGWATDDRPAGQVGES